MQKEELLTYIKQSFEDEILSKGEKRSLKEVIHSGNFSKRDFDWLRSQIFDLAREKLLGFENQQIVDWLEQTNKLLLSSDEPTGLHQVYFSPGDDCLHAINNQIDRAIKSIAICVFTISDNRIADKILRAHQRGISVKIITDNYKCNDRGSDIFKLMEAGISVKTDDTPYHMHNKFAVFDNQVIITGSYNWTRSAADHNQENILLTDEKHIVELYRNKFAKLWDELKKLT